jgi:hypothetical protein
MAGGLARQLGFCSKTTSKTTVDTNPPSGQKPKWCSDKKFVQDLTAAQSRLWTAILGAKESELYLETSPTTVSNRLGRCQYGSVESLVQQCN